MQRTEAGVRDAAPEINNYAHWVKGKRKQRFKLSPGRKA